MFSNRNSQAFVQQISLPESFELKLFSYKIGETEESETGLEDDAGMIVPFVQVCTGVPRS